MVEALYKTMTLCDWLYDIGGIFLAFSDVITDYLITYQYYAQGYTQFFWIAFSLLMLMHCFSSYLFALVYIENWCLRVIGFILFFPIAPVLQLMVWFASIGLWDALFSCESHISHELPKYDDKHDHSAEWIENKVCNIYFIII